MIIGFISDAHGNPFGLMACLKKLKEEGAEKIYFLGDAVGYWPHSEAVVSKLLKEKIICAKGNHEAMMLGILPLKPENDRIYRLLDSDLPRDFREEIAGSWPEKREIESGGKKILMVHGRPQNPLQGYLYEDGEIFPGETDGFDVVATGHTHRPYIKEKNGVLLINVGSCGLPRDIGNLASCAIYDSENHQAGIFRVEMDTQKLLDSFASGSVAPEVIECLKRR